MRTLLRLLCFCLMACLLVVGFTGVAQAAGPTKKVGGLELAAAASSEKFDFKDSNLFVDITDMFSAESEGYGGSVAWHSPSLDLRLTLTQEKVKAEFTGLPIEDDGLAYAVALNWTVWKGRELSAAIHGRYKKFPDLKRRVAFLDGEIFPDDDGFLGRIAGVNDEITVEDFQVAEAGLTVKKEWQNVSVYAGPVYRLVEATVDLKLRDVDFGFEDTLHLMDAEGKSSWGVVAGARYDADRFFVSADAVFVGGTSVMGQVGYKF